MRRGGLIEMNGIKQLNYLEARTGKKNKFLLIYKYDIILLLDFIIGIGA